MAKKKVQHKQSLADPATAELVSNELVDELRSLIAETRAGVAQAVNAAMVNLYWQVGTRSSHRDFEKPEGGLRKTDLLDTVNKIDRRVWKRLLPPIWLKYWCLPSFSRIPRFH